MTSPPSTPARLTNAVRWRSKRLWRRTLGKSAYERRVAERAAQPSWRRVDELLAFPATPADLVEAGRMIEALLPAMQRPSRHNLELVVDHAIATLDDDTSTSADTTAVSKHVHRAAIDHPAAAEGQTRRFIAYLRDSGRVDAAAAAADNMFEATGRTGYGVQLHELQLRREATAEATATVERVEHTLPPSEPTTSLLRADELLHHDDFVGAIAELDRTRPTFTRGHARRLIAANAAVGRHQDILDYLDQVYAGLPAIELHIHRFDALFALGRSDAAEHELTEAVALMTEPDERVVDRVAKAHGRAATQELLDGLVRHLDTAGDAAGQLASAGVALFRSNRPRDAVAVLRRADALQALEPVERQALAQSLYSLRQFDDALVEIDKLRGTERHWAAMKLRARILIQLGRADEALENRRRFGRPGDDTDQVLYHALLSLGRYADAFAQHPFVPDLRSLRTDFGTSAETHPSGHVGTRFIVADAGPGDEIQDASVFRELMTMSDRLVSTCDPRLQSLLERSFPDIQFIPVERFRDPPHFNSHGPDAPDRSGRSLDRLLTRAADDRARTCDRVVLGRAVKNARDLSRGPIPAAPFLVPDPAEVTAQRSALATHPRPLVGLVWRSELLTSWRAIHYLDVAELAPLADLDAGFFCLQHDATAEERATLTDLLGSRVSFADGVDLRNDFEAAAAVVANLDLVIGVATTMVNLAAAVGCPALMMQASHFGSWLATDDEGSDFWYEACRVIVADPPYDTEQLIRKTLSQARMQLGR